MSEEKETKGVRTVYDGDANKVPLGFDVGMGIRVSVFSTISNASPAGLMTDVYRGRAGNNSLME